MHNFLNPVWATRLHFGALLLVYMELVAWQHAARYDLLDWLGLLVIYTALGAIALDLIVRFRAIEIKSLLLVAGVFAVLRSALVVPIQLDSDHLVARLIFLTLGAAVLIFLLTWMSFRLLASGEASGMWAFLLAGGIGLAWGVWAGWFAPLAVLDVSRPEVSDSLPFVLLGLAAVGFMPQVLRPPTTMQTQDWLLMPYEWAAAGGVVLVTLILRGDQGYLDGVGAGILLMLLITVIFMLAFTVSLRRGTPLRLITPPQRPLLIGWLLILIPFTLMGWLAYTLSEVKEEPIQAALLFRVILIFGASWLPIVSILLGINIMSRMTREASP